MDVTNNGSEDSKLSTLRFTSNFTCLDLDLNHSPKIMHLFSSFTV